MTTPPLISIITITYNAAGVIEATLLSVASQTYRDFEHIIVDGASTDDTLGIACKFAGLRILSEADDGLYDAMNKGMKMARGKYILFLNAGDTFHSDSVLESYARYALRGDDIIYGDTVVVDINRHIIGPRHLSAPTALTFESFSQGMLICHQAFMVRKEIAPEYDLKYRFSADFDWTIRCIRNADPRRCTNLNMVTIDYLADGMTDKNKVKSLRERFDIMCHYYGRRRTVINHFGFVYRALRRKL